MDKKTLDPMFTNLLHIGNKTNHWNPKMKSYIYGSTNGVHVFNLVKTANQLEAVKKELKELTSQWKKILFVSTKLQARDSFSELASSTGNYFVNEKWVPGLLTNFKTIKKRISTYLQLLKESQNGGMDILLKKEKAAKMLELEKLDRAFKWVKEMKMLPDVVFVVDWYYEVQAVKEANSLNLPVYAIANTNTNVDLLTNVIPANTNSVKSVEFLANELKSVVKVGTSPVKWGLNKMKTRPSFKKNTPDKKETEVKKNAEVKEVVEVKEKIEVKKEEK